jgi:hypothetical protein
VIAITTFTNAAGQAFGQGEVYRVLPGMQQESAGCAACRPGLRRVLRTGFLQLDREGWYVVCLPGIFKRATGLRRAAHDFAKEESV